MSMTKRLKVLSNLQRITMKMVKKPKTEMMLRARNKGIRRVRR